MQRGRWRILGGCIASAALLAGLLFAGYLGLRAPAGIRSSLEFVAVATLLAAGAAVLAHLLADRLTRRSPTTNNVDDLATQLTAVCDNPSTPVLEQVFAPGTDWGGLQPLLEPVQLLATSYQKAVDDLVRAQQAIDVIRAAQERAGFEKGFSHSFVKRNADFSRSSSRLVARLAPNLHWMAATPALQKFLGRRMPDLSGRSFLDTVHPGDRPSLTRTFQDALRDGEGHNILFRVLVPGAKPEDATPEERHLQMDVLTRYTNEGDPLHLRCHLLDVTEKVRTDRDLRERTRQLAEANERLRQINSDLQRLKEGYRDLYNQAPVMYFSLDPRGRFAACNGTMLTILGYEREELFGQPYTRILAPAARTTYLRNPAVYGQAGEIETRWLKKDGSVIDIWIRTTPIQDEHGQFFRSRSAAQDVTERNRLTAALLAQQRELEKANEQLRRINQELDQFTYVVSHDLKEPLRTIEAFSTFLTQDYRDQLGTEGQGFLTHLTEASRRLGALISDLLLLSQAGRVINTPRPIPFAETFQTVLSDLHDLIQRREATVRLDESMAQCPILVGDPQRLMELLANLIGNALKYNTSPHPEVVVGCRPGDAAGEDGDAGSRFVTLFVRDNGIGIEPQYHAQIFQIFRRLHHREEYEGTGAGLAICQKIVEAHGGRIWVESEPGEGATFLFTLPRYTALPTSPPAESGAGEEAAAPAVGPAPVGGS